MVIGGFRTTEKKKMEEELVEEEERQRQQLEVDTELKISSLEFAMQSHQVFKSFTHFIMGEL